MYIRYVIITALLFLATTLPVCAQNGVAKQNRGLFAFYDGLSSDKGVKVSWRMRDTDDPYLTKYRLYATNAKGVKSLVNTYTDVTYANLSATTYPVASTTFSLVVLDKDNKEIDRQEGVKAQNSAALDIPMNAPTIKDENADTVLIYYTPGDCSAYDMDGDGEQEIIVKWMASQGSKAIGNRIYTPHAFYDCYKLDGTRLWRIDCGQNSNAGNNAAFFCWDYDGDGIGEMMVKSAPGTKDALGHYCGSAAKSNTGENLPGYADTLKVYKRGSDGLPTYGVWYASLGTIMDVNNGKSYEWCTVFSGKTGEELGSCDYWPYFNIQSNWYPSGSDGVNYGRRGCSQKGGVMKIPCKDGVVRPTACFQRGAYSYIYCTDFSWDGKVLQEEWRNASTAATGGTNSSYMQKDGVKTYSNKSLFAQGAHPSETADIDGDGYDELVVGAAALDHDGTVLWSTGLGHGDAVHVGDLNPENPGLEVWRITEGATKYDACMIDGKTGNILNGQLYTSGDVGRGLCFDIDSTRVGSEYCYMTSGYFYDCNGKLLYTKTFSNNTGYPNYRIYWDGDLCDEHFSGTCISKFRINGSNAYNDRYTMPGSGTNMVWKYWAVTSINGTKDNPCLQCDLYGDWREELVMFTTPGNSTARCAEGTTDYILRSLTTSWGTDRKLPWLRDDNTYSKEIACQNIGYSMPPHLGYNPFVYYDSLRAHKPEITFEPVEGKYYYMTHDGMNYVDFSKTITSSLGYIQLSDTPAVVQFEKTSKENAYYIKGNGRYLADYKTMGFQFVGTVDSATVYTAIPFARGVLFQSGTKYIGTNATGLNRTTLAANKRYFTIVAADSVTKGDVDGNGTVDYRDVIVVLNVICGEEENPKADVNNNRSTDILDVNEVIKIICGK